MLLNPKLTGILACTFDFDGSVWCVADGQDVFLIDTLAQGFETLWRIPDLAGNVRAMQRNRKESRLYVMTETPTQLILWMFNQPSCTLRSKQEFNGELNQDAPLASDANDRSVLVRSAVTISEQGDIYEQVAIHSPNQNNFQTMIRQINPRTPAAGRQSLSSGVMSGSLRHASFWGFLDGDSCLAREQDRSICAGHTIWKCRSPYPTARRERDRLAVCGRRSVVLGRPGKGIRVEHPDQPEYT
jgi:hypothetical protein